ncbi:hypothetical protein TNIN_346391 [Trichonephila inaurata madagascariensis]|uniref:Uncharacterized protein n=1 Tax=Trichonephila inaurata madagascariensis TaxID=2747483 RepID=A0A8X6XJK0_9ARAC|nr:hypothetical protein TNIN_346391 [Trichonephila inaurata madagascariensis]
MPFATVNTFRSLLSDSKSALQAVVSKSYFLSSTVKCCFDLLNWLISNDKEVAPQSIHAHYRVQGNETVNHLAKKEPQSSDNHIPHQVKC